MYIWHTGNDIWVQNPLSQMNKGHQKDVPTCGLCVHTWVASTKHWAVSPIWAQWISAICDQ